MEEKISKTPIYKVLDVREIMSKINGHTYKTAGDINISYTPLYVVIAENIQTKERERFEFYKGYTSMFLDEELCHGYSGDYCVLVPGDRFEIIQTDTYKKVKILADVIEQ